MEMRLNGKRVLVTGASRGLGAAVCQEMAREGANVIAVSRDRHRLEVLVSSLQASAIGNHVCLDADLLNPDALSAVLTRMVDQQWIPDIIVHSLGGTLGIRSPYATNEEYMAVWNLNLGIAITINNHFVPAMKEKQWGRIIHISSSSSVKLDASLPYCIMKAALNAYVVGLARNVAGAGIVVCGILPGPFEHEGSHWQKIAQTNPLRYKTFIAEHMPVGRLGTPEDFASLVTFLASDKSGFFSGSLIPVDGGMK